MSKVLGGKETVEIQRWEEDYQLVKCEGLFEEYLEMGTSLMKTARLSDMQHVLNQCRWSAVLQFGFITIFVAACPLAPLFALLNNWVEIRLDAHKFVCEYQRPVAERAQNIGVWLNILEILSHLSVTANVSWRMVIFTINVYLASSALQCCVVFVRPLQAFLIAFTSDFLPRLLYQYKFDNEFHGYINFTLAYAPLNYTDYPFCRYECGIKL